MDQSHHPVYVFADRVFVGQLPKDVTEEELSDVFNINGFKVQNISLHPSHREMHFAFVTLDPVDVDAAIAMGHEPGLYIRNHKIVVRPARTHAGRKSPRPNMAPSPGPRLVSPAAAGCRPSTPRDYSAESAHFNGSCLTLRSAGTDGSGGESFGGGGSSCSNNNNSNNNNSSNNNNTSSSSCTGKAGHNSIAMTGGGMYRSASPGYGNVQPTAPTSSAATTGPAVTGTATATLGQHANGPAHGGSGMTTANLMNELGSMYGVYPAFDPAGHMLSLGSLQSHLHHGATTATAAQLHLQQLQHLHHQQQHQQQQQQQQQHQHHQQQQQQQQQQLQQLMLAQRHNQGWIPYCGGPRSQAVYLPANPWYDVRNHQLPPGHYLTAPPFGGYATGSSGSAGGSGGQFQDHQQYHHLQHHQYQPPSLPPPPPPQQQQQQPLHHQLHHHHHYHQPEPLHVAAHHHR